VTVPDDEVALVNDGAAIVALVKIVAFDDETVENEENAITAEINL
jgi:hypothetical protein